MTSMFSVKDLVTDRVHDFWIELVTGPACKGRSSSEAMAYATALMEADKRFGPSLWHEQKLWRQIVAGPSCIGRTAQEALEYAQPFVALERKREELQIQCWRAEWEREDRRKDRIKKVLYAPFRFLGALLKALHLPTGTILTFCVFFPIYSYLCHGLFETLASTVSLTLWYHFINHTERGHRLEEAVKHSVAQAAHRVFKSKR